MGHSFALYKDTDCKITVRGKIQFNSMQFKLKSNEEYNEV